MNQPAGYQPQESSDPTVALIVEIIFGLGGVLGLGWLYAGNIAISLMVFFGYVVLVFIEFWIVALSFGLAGCIILPLNLVMIVISGFKARDYMRNTGASGSIARLLLGLVAGGGFLCGGILLISLAGGLLANFIQ